MKAALALLAGLLLAPTKYDRAADRVVFPTPAESAQWAENGPVHARVVERIMDREIWARAYERIERKLGLFNSQGEVRVVFESTSDSRPALGGGRRGVGVIRFNIPRLVKYQEKVDSFERLKAAGRIDRVIVPPMDFENLICHELTHVMCGVFEDKWLTEGIASYAADDTMHLYAFNHRRARIESLDLVVPDKDCYARGMAFFSWLEAKHGKRSVRDFARHIAFRRAEPRKALEQVTGLSWRRATVIEKLWSSVFIQRFRP